jgi:hypothetical protein
LKKENIQVKDDRSSIKLRVNFFEHNAQKAFNQSKRNSKEYNEAMNSSFLDNKSQNDVLTLGSPIKKVPKKFDRSTHTSMIITELETKLDKSFNLKNNENNDDKINGKKTILDCDIVNYDVSSSNEPFCKAFFIASLPKKNSKVIPESEDLLACCNHKECSILPSYKPDIISRFPVNDFEKMEINSLVILF